MPRVKLNNGKKMPGFGFGTWQLNEGQEVVEAVVNALKFDYRLIDTAKIYGNEDGVGQAIRASGVPREDIFVTTKLWNSDQGYESALAAFETSLGQLDMDYVDLYLIHWPQTERRHDAWRALDQIYLSDRAKAIGVSNYMVHHLEEVLSQSKTMPAVNQIEFHPFIYNRQKPILDFCRTHDIVVEAYSPLTMGRNLMHPNITAIASKAGKSNAQVILRWCVQQGTIPIPRSTNPSHIAENINIFDFKLSDQDMESLNQLGESSDWSPNTA